MHASTVILLFKALAAGERWITVRPNGPGTEGHPLLIKPAGDGSMKVIGGAGGKMNHLRLTGVRSEASYKEEARANSKRHKEARARQVEQDKKDGLHGNKTAAREAVRAQLREHEHKFVQHVAKTLGWSDEDMRYPEEQFANLTPSAQKKAAEDHARKLFAHAKQAVDVQRTRLVQDAELRTEAGLGEVPLTAAAPEALSVQDLAPVEAATKGLGFAPAYDKRAAEQGLTKDALKEEADASRPPPEHPTPEGMPTPAERRRAMGESIATELKAIRDPGPKVDPLAMVDAKAAVGLLKAEKELKAARKAAGEQKKKIDAAKEPVEPKAYILEVAGTMPDAAVTKDLENDLRTLKTRAFLDEVGRLPGGEASVGRHIGVGAFNSINSVALAAGGASLLDRSVVDVLGIAGSAQVLARRLASDLTPDELEHLKAAMGRFHVDHYMQASDQALREARDFHEMAQEIELGEAAHGQDLAAAQELNAKRREMVGHAERTLGTALGEMEANAAIVVALEQPKKDQVQVSLGRTSLEQAITRARALGLQRGEYAVEQAGASTILTVHGPGMERLAAPLAKADLERTRTALAIIDGHEDEDDWLPGGVTRRPEAAMNALPGVASRLAQPFQVGAAGMDRAVEDYIGGRAADGDSAADIMAGLLSEDVLRKAGDRGSFMKAVERLCPLYDGDGKLVRAEAYGDKFEALADQFAERTLGGALPPIHRQQFAVDQVAVNSLHAALAAHPDGIAAWKPVGELTPQDQGAIRAAFAREHGRSDPAAESMRAELAKLDGAEPVREVQDMFGTGPNPLHADWRGRRDALAEKLNAASMTWSKYINVMGSPANAYRAMQDTIRSNVVKAFAEVHNRSRPDAPLKLGRAAITHDLNHLDALDPAARETRLAQHRELVDGLRNRVAGKYSSGSVADKLDAERAHEQAFQQSQLGMFGTDPAESRGDLRGASRDDDDEEPPGHEVVGSLTRASLEAGSQTGNKRLPGEVDAGQMGEAFHGQIAAAVGRGHQVVHVDESGKETRLTSRGGRTVMAKDGAGVGWMGMMSNNRHRIEFRAPGAAKPAKSRGDLRGAAETPLGLGERHTIGHAAERQIAGMMPIVGANFKPGQPVALWSPSMSGKYVMRQRAVKLIQHNKRTMLGMGVGSGKTSIALSAFTHLLEQGKAKRGLFAVPSIVQGQFGGEALTLLEPGKYNWHADPGASRADRIAAYKDPSVHFNVVTHQALRDDLLHMASKREGTTPDAIAERLEGMKPAERRDYMKGVLEAEGIDHDYMAVDEGHTLLNRQGKENSRMANVLDGVAHGMGTYVSMTADPVKNDPSEAFDVLAKMDPDRYSDRDAFMRKYGVDTPAAKDGLRREMARHFYTGSIDPGVKANKTEVPVELDASQQRALSAIDGAAVAARLARMKGEVDLPALRTLSPSSFAGQDEAKHQGIAETLNRSIGILHNTAVHHAVSGASKTEVLAKIAKDRKGRPGVVFCHHLDRVGEIEKRLRADGHRVVTLTGGDSTAEKDRKKREFQAGKHDVIVMSDAGAVGANLQKGKWLAQYDTPQTAMVHAQRNGRIHRIGQTEDVELLDLVANHPAERRARKRLADKYELRSIMTSPLEGLDDTGVAGYLGRARAGRLDAAEPVHPPSDPDPSAGGWRSTDASERLLPGQRQRMNLGTGKQEVFQAPAPHEMPDVVPDEQASLF